MRVFLSWSGSTSRQIAEVLYGWIPKVLQAVEPFLSSQDIEKGERWLSSISTNLENIDVGIVVMTKTNILAPWINFEAGALSKKIDRSRIIPVLFEITDTDLVNHPLAQFQYVKLEKDDLLRLFRMLNLSCPRPLNEAQFEETFNLWFEKHFEMLANVKSSEPKKGKAATPSEVNDGEDRFRRMEAAIDEILNYQRRMRNEVKRVSSYRESGSDRGKGILKITGRDKESFSARQAYKVFVELMELVPQVELLGIGAEGATISFKRSPANINLLQQVLARHDEVVAVVSDEGDVFDRSYT
jgi:hypothetical protein